MPSLHTLDRVGMAFDEHRLIAHAGLLLPATIYLRRLEGEEDKGWAKVAQAIGVR